MGGDSESSKYVIGIDIGATKSHLAIYKVGPSAGDGSVNGSVDDSVNGHVNGASVSCSHNNGASVDGSYNNGACVGGLVGLNSWGPLNHEVLPGSFTQFEAEFTQFVTQALSIAGIAMRQVAFAVLGVAGVDTRRQHQIISEIIKRVGIKCFVLCNDSYLGVPAGAPSGVGICANNGTGYTVTGIDVSGGMLQIGGVGMISDDRGGGGYIGERAIAAVYNSLFRFAEPTLMKDYIFDRLGVADKNDFVEILSQKIADDEADIGYFNRFVFLAAGRGDRVAESILSDIADSYANSITYILRELDYPADRAVTVVFAGSVFVKGESPFLLDAIKKKVALDNAGRLFEFTVLKRPPVAGAIVWALNKMGCGENEIEKAYSRFS